MLEKVLSRKCVILCSISDCVAYLTNLSHVLYVHIKGLTSLSNAEKKSLYEPGRDTIAELIVIAVSDNQHIANKIYKITLPMQSGDPGLNQRISNINIVMQALNVSLIEHLIPVSLGALSEDDSDDDFVE